MKKWKDVKKELEEGFKEEDFLELELEKQIILATIEARKNANMTQRELSKKSGVVQPAIAKIETFNRIPQYTTLMRLLYPLGYTLKVVPLDKKNKEHK